jgi:hypothetical protein
MEYRIFDLCHNSAYAADSNVSIYLAIIDLWSLAWYKSGTEDVKNAHAERTILERI